MAIYYYTAINTAGKRVKSRVDAASMETAKASLRNIGYFVLDIQPQAQYNKDINLPFLGYPKPKHMAIFCRQFASILRAGVPVSNALGMMGQQTENKRLRDAIRAMMGDVEKGSTLADAMRKHPKIFNAMLVSMAQAGEQSGNLETVFGQMEIYFDKSSRTRSAVRGAMLYPIILLVVMVAVLIVFMTRVIPSFTRTFESMNAELPAITKAVIAVSDWMGHWWWALFLGVIVLVLLGSAFKRTNRGKHFFGWFGLRIPVVKKLNINNACAIFARNQSLLQASGLTLMESLSLCADNMKNIYFKEAVYKIREGASRGVSLANAIRDAGVFPHMICNMVGIGEESGDLVGMLDKTADYYDDEVKQSTQTLLGLMQPALILFMAVFVVILVLAIFLPMLQMTSAYDQYLQ